jgi:hypothetical protein
VSSSFPKVSAPVTFDGPLISTYVSLKNARRYTNRKPFDRESE